MIELKQTYKQMNLVDVYRVFHATSEYTFSATHRVFSKTDHMLSHRRYLHKYKRTEIIPCILSNHSAKKLEINDKNSTDTWKSNNTFLKKTNKQTKNPMVYR